MNKLAEALYYDDIATAASYILRVKTAQRNNTLFDSLSDLSVAADGILREKEAAFNDGVDESIVLPVALYDAAKGIIRMRNLQMYQ